MSLTPSISTNGKRGFSLVELLLTLVLLMCLAAATVFSFSAIHRSSNLDEGVDRLQSVFRFARAQAATSGRKVRIVFEQTKGEIGGSELKGVRIAWEPDSQKSPGVFETMTNTGWNEDLINDLVGIEEVRAAGQKPKEAKEDSAKVDTEQMVQAVQAVQAETAIQETGEQGEAQGITFYPDGSSDSAEIIVASRNTEDARRLSVTLSGMLGSVTTRAVGKDEGASDVSSGDFDENGQPREYSQASADTARDLSP